MTNDQSLGLFDPTVAVAAAPKRSMAEMEALEIEASTVAREALGAVDKCRLPETNDALARLPEVLRPAAERIADNIFERKFLAQERHLFLNPNKHAYSQVVRTHSAKLEAFSAVGYFASGAWHLADNVVLGKISAALAAADDFEGAQKILKSVPSVNLFVAAQDSDDRDSYLRAVKAYVKRHKVNNLVLDAELIEWAPSAEFLATCAELGMRPTHVSIVDRESAGKHAMLRSDTSAAAVPALFVDTKGRQMNARPNGSLVLANPEASAQPAASAKREQVAPRIPVSVERPAVATELQGVPPPAALHDRMARLQSAQRTRLHRP